MAFIENVYNEECCDLTTRNCRDTHYAAASKSCKNLPGSI